MWFRVGALLFVVWFVKETRVWVLGWCYDFHGLVRKGDTCGFGSVLCFLWSAVNLFSNLNKIYFGYFILLTFDLVIIVNTVTADLTGCLAKKDPLVVWFVKETHMWVLGWCFAFNGLVR